MGELMTPEEIYQGITQTIVGIDPKIWIAVGAGAVALITLIIVIVCAIKRKIAENEVQELTIKTYTPSEFFALRRGMLASKTSPEMAGVYVLYNQTRNKYYVGQGHQLLNRVNAHLTGSGNGRVYADYRYGDRFTVQLIPLQGSGFKSLNELERVAIRRYEAFGKGYNRTRGNKD